MTTTKFHLNLVSANRKVGPIPVSTTSRSSCPKTCAFYDKGCYAKAGPMAIHWRKVGEERGISATEFLSLIKNLPDNQFWRHNQAGDLPQEKEGYIDQKFVKALVSANSGKKGFTYTHHDISKKENLKIVKEANEKGFTINLSGNNIDHAIELSKTNLPVVAVVPSDTKVKHFEYKGEKFLVCPATYNERINCDRCRLCQKVNRKYIIAFPAHGTSKKIIDKTLKTN